MLSPGSDWQRVPKGKKENLAFRRVIQDRALQSKRVRQRLIDLCTHDLLFYVNVFVGSYDPRNKEGGGIIGGGPFITWPIQDKAFPVILECVEQGRDLVIEKSRDMGASWMSLIVMEWLWHFHRDTSFLMVSRKEDLVDKPGFPDALFWKVDFIHRHLPEWLRCRLDRRKLHFGNLENGSTIDGESTTAAAGVGGRRTAMFIDEFSRIEEGYQLLAGTADTTRCRIFNFTPFGTSNAAYKLARRGDVRKLRLHWSEHPEKARGLYRFDAHTQRVELLDKGFSHGEAFNFIMDGRLRSPWYDAECARRANDREVAQMLDIDYQGSAYQFFDRSLILDLQRTYGCAPFWEGDISYDLDTGRPSGLVRADGGPLRMWAHPQGNGVPPIAPYAAGADIAYGTGRTPSCLAIGNAATGEKIAEYTNPFIRPEQFALVCVALCRWFKDREGQPALFAWEMQGPGVAFGKKVIELGFRNVHYRVSEQKLAPKSIADTPGWFPSADNVRVLLEQYRSALAGRHFLNRSVEALEECLSFIHTAKGTLEHAEVQDKDDPTGAGHNHADHVIADALCWKMCRQLGKPAPEREMEERPNVCSLAYRRRMADDVAREQEAWA